MPFDDWNHAFANTTSGGIQVDDPIVGSASLEVADTSTAVQAGYRNYWIGGGFMKGRLRTLIRFDAETVGTFKPYVALWCFSASLPVSGNHYAMHVELGTTNNVRIITSSNPLGSSFTTFSQGDKPLAIGEVLPIEFEWNRDDTGLGGTALVARAGNIGDEDYTNLATVCGFTDFTPLTVAAGEGMYVNKQAGSAVTVTFDQTELYSGV